MQWKKYIADCLMVIGLLCSIVLINYAIKGVFPFGERMIFWGDLPQQGIPWLYDAYDVFTGAASSDFTWRYSGGLGGNASLLSNLFDLPILLSDRAYIYQIFPLLLLFKMCCMGLAMYYFACRYDVRRRYRIIASVLYGTGSCVLIHYQIGNVMLDIAILFPILMAGFYDLMEKNRPILYIALLALCICKSVYVSFMICMYIFSISIPYFFFRVPRDMFWIKCRNLIVSTLIAAGLSSVFLLSMVSSLGDSNRIAWSGGNNSNSGGTYIRAIIDYNMFTHYSGLSMLCIFMGSALPIASIRMGWKKMTGSLKYHQVQLIMILAAVIVPGTEVLWHGGSHALWTIRFAFILNFVFIEMFLAMAQQKMLGAIEDAGDISERKTLLFSILFLVCIITSEFLLRKIGANSIFILFLVSIILTLLWIFFYDFLFKYPIKRKAILICTALSLELFFNGFLWIGPEFVKMSPSPNQVTPDWNTEDFCRYIPQAAKLSTELNRDMISPLCRTRDIDNSFNSNYAAITNTYSITNYRGSIPNWVDKLYICLGYGCEYVRILDSGGTLFSDALLGIHSTFTTGRSLSEEFYQEDSSIQSVRWYWNRYTLPAGIVLKGDAEPNEDVFEYQNHIFQALTGQEEKLIQEFSFPMKSTHKINIQIDGRKELYFYVDTLYKVSKEKQLDSIFVNGIAFQIPNLTEEDNLGYPVEFNNRLLDLGTFENETVVLEFIQSNHNVTSNIHLGLLDIPKMKAAFDNIRKDNYVDCVKIGTSSISMHQISSNAGILFLPILYSDCWKCEVNGAPSELTHVLGGFVGIPVEAEENEIRMVYTPKSSIPGRILVAISAILGVIFIFLAKKGQLNSSWKFLDHGLGICYLSLSALFTIFIYFLPILAFLFIHITWLFNKITFFN